MIEDVRTKLPTDEEHLKMQFMGSGLQKVATNLIIPNTYIARENTSVAIGLHLLTKAQSPLSENFHRREGLHTCTGAWLSNTVLLRLLWVKIKRWMKELCVSTSYVN